MSILTPPPDGSPPPESIVAAVGGGLAGVLGASVSVLQTKLSGRQAIAAALGAIPMGAATAVICKDKYPETPLVLAVIAGTAPGFLTMFLLIGFVTFGTRLSKILPDVICRWLRLPADDPPPKPHIPGDDRVP